MTFTKTIKNIENQGNHECCKQRNRDTKRKYKYAKSKNIAWLKYYGQYI